MRRVSRRIHMDPRPEVPSVDFLYRLPLAVDGELRALLDQLGLQALARLHPCLGHEAEEIPTDASPPHVILR